MRSFCTVRRHTSTGLLVVTGVFGFSIASLLFLLSPYLKDVLHTENVSWLYSLPEIGALAFFSFFLKRSRVWGKAPLFLMLVFAQITVLFLLLLCNGSYWSLVPIGFYLFLIPFFMMFFDAFLEEESSDEESGRMRGLHILFFNGGMLFAPFFAGLVMEKFRFSGVLLMVILCYIVMGAGISRARREKREIHGRRAQISWNAVWKKMAKNPDMRSLYGVSVLLESFYAMSVVSFPLFLADTGLNFSQAGTVFTVMLLPFLLFAYPAGRLADTRWGEKELLIGALIFLSIALFILSITRSSDLWVWAGLLFCTRIGASLVETMRDTSFYRKVDGKDFDLIAFFRTARSVGITLATLGMFLFFTVFPSSFRMLFVIFAYLLLTGIVFVVRIRDTEPKKNITQE